MLSVVSPRSVVLISLSLPLGHPLLAQLRVPAVLLNAAAAGFPLAVAALGGVVGERRLVGEMLQGIGRLRLPLHDPVLGAEPDVLGGSVGADGAHAVALAVLISLLDVYLGKDLPVPELVEGVPERLVLAVAGVGELEELLDNCISALGQKPEVVVLGLDVVGGSGGLVGVLLMRVVVVGLPDALGLDDNGGLLGAAASSEEDVDGWTVDKRAVTELERVLELTKVLGELLVVEPPLGLESELGDPLPDVRLDERDADARHLYVLGLALQTGGLGQGDRLVERVLKEGNDLSADASVGVGHAGLEVVEEVGLDQLAGDDDALRLAEVVQPLGELGEPLVVGAQR